MYTVFSDSRTQRVEFVQDVDRVLDQLHEQHRHGEPTLVTVELDDNGDTLSIGLGAPLSVLNFVRGDKNPPYYTSAGGRDSNEVISFRFGGGWSEYPLRAALPIEVARAAMRQFCEAGRLPQAVEWEEV